MEQASELEYLQWFFVSSDFGPADSDVKLLMEKQFTEETGMQVPSEYHCE